jgi:hypothetical protein
MITCLKCGEGGLTNIYRCILEPANDKFKCKNCGHIQLRYSGTKYETEAEKEIRLNKEKKGGK